MTSRTPNDPSHRSSVSSRNHRTRRPLVWGHVRASPSGACLVRPHPPPPTQEDPIPAQAQEAQARSLAWHDWRQQHLPPLVHPPEGFDHLHDPNPLSPPVSPKSSQQQEQQEQEHVLEKEKKDDWTPTQFQQMLAQPVASLRDKWRLVPHFLALRSLLRQHIASFDHLIQTELQHIITSPSNCEIRSDHDAKFYIRYEQVWLGPTPTLEEDSFQSTALTPHLCRVRDLTYAAPLLANIRYTRGHQVVLKRGVCIGRMPIMLQSHTCVLRNKNHDALAALHECPYDPGGYFIIKGVEKTILIQEQLSKNRVIIEKENNNNNSNNSSSSSDPQNENPSQSQPQHTSTSTSTNNSNTVITASITSSTHERKSKSYIIWKHGKVWLRNNTIDDVPIVIVFKALGLESDYEMVSLIAGGGGGGGGSGSSTRHSTTTPISDRIMAALASSMDEASKLGVQTQMQALRYMGGKIKSRSSSSSSSSSSHLSNTGTPLVTNNANTSGSVQAVSVGGGVGGMTAAAGAGVGVGSGRRSLSPEEEARDLLAHVILSHVPVEHFDFRIKAIYVAHVVRRVLLTSLNLIPVDDKDYYGNKRLELAGNLLALLFEDLFKLFNKDLKRQADAVLSKPNRATPFDVLKTIRTDIITHGMISAIATGNWVLKRFRMDRAGVTQVLSRLSYLSALGMMTRIHSQFEKTRKVSGPRSLQPSQWGMLCPADTPEGEACGLVKNLALLAHITTDDESNNHTIPITRICFDLGVEDVNRMTGQEIYYSGSNSYAYFVVFVNGGILGIHKHPHVFVQQVRQLRRQGQVGEFVSVYLHEEQRAVHLATDGGRVCRPLIIVDPISGKPKLEQWQIEALNMNVLTIRDLLNQGVVEYVDCNEENNTLIAVDEKHLLQQQQHIHAEATAADDSCGDLSSTGKKRIPYTHLEIDPFTVLGVVGGIIPFPHHNQSPRNTYTVAMAKQAIGTVALNQYERCDGLLYTLVYPQKPLTKSRTLDLIHFDDMPGGQNACIAVMSYSGYDIEDSIILNKASIDRGYGRCMVLRKHVTSIRQYANGTHDRTCAPPNANLFVRGEQDTRYAKYAALDTDGICRVGELLHSGSILCNKESPTDTTTNMMLSMDLMMSGSGNEQQVPRPVQYKSSSVAYRSSAPSYVDKVLITSNEQEQFLIKIMLRQVRRPEIGDKFASRHGQKGVCGLIVREEDLPFNEHGVVPDLIMNPHGFPSRMTVGKLLELLVGKAGVYEGRQAYASAFGEALNSADTAECAAAALIRNGLNYTGKDIFYSGTNGTPLDAYIFSGPVFYQKLKHMVLDKAHARARGPRAILTRQPTEGRSREGGLRLGEMERDCLIAYGASNLIMERLMHSSDAFVAHVCMNCGLIQYQNWCQYCRRSRSSSSSNGGGGGGESVVEIRLPYACKLLFQELQSMNVLPRLRLKDYS